MNAVTNIRYEAKISTPKEFQNINIDISDNYSDDMWDDFVSELNDWRENPEEGFGYEADELQSFTDEKIQEIIIDYLQSPGKLIISREVTG